MSAIPQLPQDSPPKKLLERLRDVIRAKHYSIRTEDAYHDWVKRFTLRVFHNKCHPETMGVPEINIFLTHLAVQENVSASTQNQALNAIVFLYREVLHLELDGPIRPVRAKQPERLPVVLSKAEALIVINQLSGDLRLMAQLLYGSGLRLMECLRLRVKLVLSLPKETWTLKNTRLLFVKAKASKTGQPCCPTRSLLPFRPTLFAFANST